MQFNFGIGETYQWYVPTTDKQRQPARGKQRPPYARRIRPPYTYTELITQAITASEDRALTLRQIVSCLENRYPCFRGPYRGWRNSIRHNLSASECFRKILKDESKPNGKDNYWTMNEHCTHCKQKDGHSKSNDGVTTARRMVGRRQKRDHGHITELNTNEGDTEVTTVATTEIQKVDGPGIHTDEGSLVSRTLIGASQANIDGSSRPEDIHLTTRGAGEHSANSGGVAWQEMEGFNIEKFTYNPCYECSYNSNSSPQQTYDTDPQQHHVQVQPRSLVQSYPRPYPVQLTTSQGYPMTHDVYRNGYCPPPYNMVDQHMYFQGSGPTHQQQQYLKMNNGSFYGPGSQAAQQMQFMNNRLHQESVYY